MSKFYTYAYLRKDGTPYYIGKGTGYRLIDKKNRAFPPPKDRSRIIKLKQNLTEEEAYKHERYMIFVLGRKDLGTGILHNHTDGGEGPRGFSPETLAVMAAKASHPLPTATRKKISKALTGRKRPPEACAAISKGLTGRKLSPESIAKREETKRRKRNESN